NRRILLLQQIALFGVLIDGAGERGAESGQMRTAVRIRNRIRKWQNLVVVAVVVLQHNIDKYFLALPGNHDRLRMQHLFVLAELFYKLFDTVLIEERFSPRRRAALIRERDFQ